MAESEWTFVSLWSRSWSAWKIRSILLIDAWRFSRRVDCDSGCMIQNNTLSVTTIGLMPMLSDPSNLLLKYSARKQVLEYFPRLSNIFNKITPHHWGQRDNIGLWWVIGSLIFISVSLCHVWCQYVTFGASFMTSDVQFVNYANIWSEGSAWKIR